AHVAQVLGAQAALADRVGQEPQNGADLHASPRRLRRLLAAGPRSIRRVHEHGHASVSAQSCSESDVVAVAVREDVGFAVCSASADLGKSALQIVPVPGEPRVDERDAGIVNDQVGGDDVISDTTKSRYKFHDGYDT